MRIDLMEIKEMRILYGQISEAVELIDKIRWGSLAGKHIMLDRIENINGMFRNLEEIQLEFYYQLQKEEKSYAKNIGKKRKQNKRVCV